VTQVKEFKFASESRSRRSPERIVNASLDNPRVRSQGRPSQVIAAGGSPRKSTAVGNNGTKSVETGVEGAVRDGDRGDEGIDVRMRAREIGKASILAWGETRGRYLDD